MTSPYHSTSTPYPEETSEAQQRPDSPEVKETPKTNNMKTDGNLRMILAIVCLVLEAIIFLFCVVGTPVDAFKSRSNVGVRYCYSMWGYKRCGAHKTNPFNSAYKGFPTKQIRNTMNAAAAFAIISIFVTLVALVLTVLLVCKSMRNMIPGVVSVIAFITTLIVWACQAGAYHKKYDAVFPVGARAQISTVYKYHGSFGLFVTAWCLQTIEMVLVFFA